jgi:hypothetical protein
MRLDVRCQRAEYSGRVGIDVRERVDSRLLARGAGADADGAHDGNVSPPPTPALLSSLRVAVFQARDRITDLCRTSHWASGPYAPEEEIIRVVRGKPGATADTPQSAAQGADYRRDDLTCSPRRRGDRTETDADHDIRRGRTGPEPRVGGLCSKMCDPA